MKTVDNHMLIEIEGDNDDKDERECERYHERKEEAMSYYGDCRTCRHFGECYSLNRDATNMNEALVGYFSSLLKRDLCVNNDKGDWEAKV